MAFSRVSEQKPVSQPSWRLSASALIALAFSTLSLATVEGAELATLEWKTGSASPPPELDEQQEQIISLVRMGLESMSEPAAMRLAFLGGESMNIRGADMTSLQNGLNRFYAKIGEDPLFSSAPTHLPYCFSAKKPDHGLASVYIPTTTGPQTPVILFLHGFGGSFQLYQYYLARQFHDHIIICPAYGISMAEVPQLYLEECLAEAQGKIGHRLRRPILMGLSAGGFGGFREYARNSSAYSGFICLAAYPPEDMLPIEDENTKMRILAGAQEYWVKDRTLEKSEWKLLKGNYHHATIPGADHFFLLTHERESRRFLRLWTDELKQPELAPDYRQP